MAKVSFSTTVAYCKNTGKVLWESNCGNDIDGIIYIPKGYLTEEEIKKGGWTKSGDHVHSFEYTPYEILNLDENYQNVRITRVSLTVDVDVMKC